MKPIERHNVSQAKEITAMRLNELKAAALRKLTLCASAEEIVQFHGLEHFAITVEHRGFEYEVGHWLGYQAPFWAYEVRTGIIYRGTLQDVKEWIKICSYTGHLRCN